MSNLQDRRYLRRILRSRVFMGFLLLVAILLSRSVYGIYKKVEIARINRIESERKLSALQEKEQHLREEIGKLKTTRGIEEELRNKFQITKTGEEVLVVVDEPVAVTNSNSFSKDEDGLWRKFTKIFGY